MAMINKKKKLMTTAIAGSMAAAIAVGGGTFAYLQSQTNDVVNNFQTEQVKVEIDETPNDYDIIPGTEQSKDPKVTITNTLDSFLFVRVTDNTDGLVTYEIADGWTKLDGYEDVYYRRVAGSDQAQEFYVLKDNKVSYDKEIVNEDMLDENGNLRTDVALSFKAFAIQARPFEDPTDPENPGTTTPTESQAAVLAYNAAEPKTASTASELRTAISNVENGGLVELTEDIDARIGISNGKTFTLDLNGHTVKGLNVTNNSNVTVSDGTISAPDGQGIQVSGGKLTVSEDAVVEGAWGITVFGTNDVVDVYGTVLSDIFVSGNLKSGNAVVNIHNGAVVDGDNDDDGEGSNGIALNGHATVNIESGATVKGITGVEVRAGNLNVKDGATIIGTGTPTSVEGNNNGTTTIGAGIGVAQHTTKLPINVNITGGTIKGYTAFNESNSENNDDESLDKITINITGGTFETINGGTEVFKVADTDKIHYTNTVAE